MFFNLNANTEKIRDALPNAPFYAVVNGLAYPCESCDPDPDEPGSHYCKIQNANAYISVPPETEWFHIATTTPKI